LEVDLGGYQGGLIKQLILDLQSLRATGASAAELQSFLQGVATRPARWLAQNYFGW